MGWDRQQAAPAAIVIGAVADFDSEEGVSTRVVEESPDTEQPRGEVDLPDGDVSTRYTLLECLGRGGGGVVYAAYDRELERRVAIKLVRADAAGSTGASDAQSRLIREARALARLAHPNVIHVYDVALYEPGCLGRALSEFAEQDELPAERGVFLVMELVEGSTLAEWRASRTPSWREVLKVMIPAGRGLCAAHRQSLVHRDFKPQNVQIGEDGRVRVLDFGLARASTGELSSSRLGTSETDDGLTRGSQDGSGAGAASPMTEAGTVMGTPRYMSPEQHRGEQATEAADVYAFCVVLYEMLTGVPPFRGSSIAKLRRSKEAGEIRDPPPGIVIPKPLWRAIVRGLSPRREDRFPSVAHLLERIEAVPRARRRKAIAAVAAIVAVLGGGAGVAAWHEIRESRCELGPLELAGVWDDQVKQAARAGLLATKLSYADKSWTAIEGAFDGYTSRWLKLKREVCRAGRIEQTRPVEVTQWQADCLQAALDAAGALADRLRDADVEVAQRAVEAAMSLPSLERCASIDIAESELVRGDEERARRRAHERDLARLDTHIKMARYEAADELAQRALERAQTEQLRDIEARAHFALAQIATGLGQADRAEQELHDAVAAAEEAGDDDTATRAYVALLFALANRGELERGDRLATQVAARLRRRGVEDELEAEYNRALGNLRRAEGRFELALEAFERAHAILVEVLQADHPQIARALSALGAARYNLAQYPKALELQQRALDMYRAALGETHPRVGWTLQRVAHTTWMLEGAKKAVVPAQQAADVLADALGPQHPDLGDALGDLAALTQVAGDTERALELHERVLAIAEQHSGTDNPDYARKLGNYGLTLNATGRREEAIAAFLRQLEINQRIFGEDHVEVAYPHQYLAGTLVAENRAAEAVEHAERSVEIRERAHGPDHPFVAGSLVTLGIVHAKLGARPRAREALARAISIFDRLEGSSRGRLGDAAFELARLLPASESKKAVELARKARQAYSSVENTRGVAKVDQWLERRGAAR
jgi:serine/threonine protein kinase